MKPHFLAIVVSLAACSPAPTPPPTAQPVAPASSTQPSAAVTSEAISRADALIADMRRNEAATAKLDRELAHAPSPTPREILARFEPRAETAAPTTTSAPPTAEPAPQAAPPAPAAPARDEAWWKDQMRTADVRLTESIRRLQHALDERDAAVNQMGLAVKAGSVVFAQAQEAANLARAEVGRLEAEVRNARAAVERLREDARRANVPPGWLRWP